MPKIRIHVRSRAQICSHSCWKRDRTTGHALPAQCYDDPSLAVPYSPPPHHPLGTMGLNKRKRAPSNSKMTSSDTGKSAASQAARSLKRGRAREELDAVRHGEPMARALSLVDGLLADPAADAFARPVLEMWSIDEVPGYAEVVPEPMDLGTVRKNTKSLEYIHDVGGVIDFDDNRFVADVRKVFRNCMAYNDSKSEFYRIAKRMLAQVGRKFKPRLVADESESSDDAHAHADADADADADANAHEEMESEESSEGYEEEEDEEGGEEPLERSDERRTKRARVEPPEKKSPTPRAAAAAEATARAEAAKAEAKAIAEQLAAEKTAKAAKAKAARKAAQARELAEVLASAVSTAADSSSLMKAPKPPKGKAKIGRPRSDAKAAAGIVGSSISGDEVERGVVESDGVNFLFVSTDGLQRRRGRKSALVQDLENKHDVLTKRRKILLDSKATLEANTRIPLTVMEKTSLCDSVAVLDYVRMAAVVNIIAQGMGCKEILDKPEVDMPISNLSNAVLRRIQSYLEAPAVIASLGTLGDIDQEIADIESTIVSVRFARVSA